MGMGSLDPGLHFTCNLKRGQVASTLFSCVLKTGVA